MRNFFIISSILIMASSSGLYAEGIKITPYGCLKLDASVDTAEISNGNYARWVSGAEDNAQYNMTVRQTKLGMNLAGADTDKVKTDGKVEVDFYNASEENKNTVMLRHAYFKSLFPATGIEILAGQTSDVISPLVPDTLNYTVAWWCGDVGYRRPQLRLTKDMGISDKSSAKVDVAATRTIGSEGTTGESSGIPTLQARLGLTVGPATFGVSGHYGEEEYDNISDEVETSSLNVDLSVKLCSKAAIKAEYFTGKDLDAYLGGIGQGIDDTADTEGTVTAVDGVESEGGWVAIEMGPFGACKFNIGAGMDDPEDSDLDSGDRSKNTSIWGNVKYAITDALSVGLEVSQWETDYIGETSGRDATRCQGSMMYTF